MTPWDEFKFQIGDVVTLKGSSAKGLAMFATKPRFVVQEQILQRCSGGTQRNYGVIYEDRSGRVVATSLVEAVLELLPPEDGE